MPLNQANLAGNVRRLAGMHLVTMESLAEYVGMSRQAIQGVVGHDPEQRSLPRADTAIKLAEAFGVSLNALYQEPGECLREAAESFDRAPIADFTRTRLEQRVAEKRRAFEMRRTTDPPPTEVEADQT